MALSGAEKEFYRRTAAACFNRAWEHLEKNHLDSKEKAEMLHFAHASRYHWGVLGGARQQAVGDWQVARAYAALGDSELSLMSALSSLSLCEKKRIDELIPSAMEGLARAYATAGDWSNATKLIGVAREKLRNLKLGAKERGIFESQIQETESLIRRNRARE